jgi:glycosyltransferase EpsE
MNSETKTRITVLIGAYNCASTLVEALDSLMTQTYKGFRIVLCDDGSKDNTLEVAEKYSRQHSNLIIIHNEHNKGLNYTLNRCLDYADTEYVARMDGDDISLPSRFEKEICFLDAHPEYAVVSSPMIYFDEGGPFRRGKGKGEIKAIDFVHGTPICHAPCMARTQVIKQVGGYSVNDKLLRVEDYHLWFKVFSSGEKLYMLDECLYMMRDDRNAIRRRDWMTRKNEAYVKHIGYKMIGLPWYYQVYAISPLIKYFVPTFIYRHFHKVH